MASLYSPEQIAGFLAQEKLAIHGISPEVYAQNQQLLLALGKAASECSSDLISVQLLGSRADGNADLQSDVDLCIVSFDTDNRFDDEERVRQAVEQTGLRHDLPGGPLGRALEELVPPNPTDFIYWVEGGPSSAAFSTPPKCLFEEGVATSPNAKFAQFAVTSILHTFPSKGERAARWGNIRTSFEVSYFDEKERIRENLIARLGADKAPEIHRLINDDLIRARARKYGLPKSLATAHNRLKSWVETEGQGHAELPGYRLYQGVLAEL